MAVMCEECKCSIYLEDKADGSREYGGCDNGCECCNGEQTLCEDCDSPVTITLEPYGSGKMAVIECPECGTSYDTNLDESEGE